MLSWKKPRRESLLPPERVPQAIAAGIRFVMLLVPDSHVAIALLGLYAAGAVLYYGVTFSSFVTHTPSHLRAGASATMFLAMNLFGYGVAPQFAGVASDVAASLGAANPLRFALVIFGMLFAIGGLFLILAGRALRRSEPIGEPIPALT